MTYPQTGDLLEYIPCGKIYLIMERIDDLYQDYMILSLDNNEVVQYSFENHAIDLWRRVA